MNGILVRDLDDLVALHDVEADAADARVRLVIGVKVASVIGAVGERRMRMVQVTVLIDAAPIFQEFATFRREPFGQHAQALICLAPARGAVAVEHGNAHQLAHRGAADDADFTRLAAGKEHVILVEFARLHLVVIANRGPCGWRGRPGLRFRG